MSGSRIGRPRLAEVDEAIGSATQSLLAEVGYSDLTIDEVARRAGVGKPTVYRRHASKAQLVASVLHRSLEHANPETPDTGDPALDLRQLLTNLARALTQTLFGPAVVEVIAPARHNADLEALFDTVTSERRRLMHSVLADAHRSSRLRAIDVETAVDMTLGAIYFRFMFSKGPLDADFIDGLVWSVVRDDPAVQR
ncbi:MAG: TetR/AcrR family transcriptional regulator [Acidimicrobiales bacterium]|nr:TetR/AcrR family transcriptional regulator [Acidimicrobiales bacterium]